MFFLSAVAVFLFQACGWQQAKSETTVPFAADEIKSDVPFSTQEPENFQAEFVVIANNRESKTFVARSGGNRRYDYNFGAENQWTVLQTAANQSFLTLPDKKIYAENFASAIAQTTDGFKDFLTNEWLNSKADAKFTKLGAENDLTKYRVVLNDGENAETIVFVDEKIGLPVRQEFYGGAPKNLTFVFEMRNFKTETENNLFEIPKDFRKVSTENLKAAMKKENSGDE